MKTSEAMSQLDAAAALGRSVVYPLIFLGVLEPVLMENGYQGVSRASVEAEVEWQNSSTRFQRIRRRTGQVLSAVLNVSPF